MPGHKWYCPFKSQYSWIILPPSNKTVQIHQGWVKSLCKGLMFFQILQTFSRLWIDEYQSAGVRPPGADLRVWIRAGVHLTHLPSHHSGRKSMFHVTKSVKRQQMRTRWGFSPLTMQLRVSWSIGFGASVFLGSGQETQIKSHLAF